MGLIVVVTMQTDVLSEEKMHKLMMMTVTVMVLGMFSFVGMMWSHDLYMSDRKKKGLHRWTRENMDELEKRVKALEEKIGRD